jgi:hypothetical protein
MPNPHDHPAALKDLQNSIYREKILRARSMTTAQRLNDVFELSDSCIGYALSGALNRLGTKDQLAGWAEVRKAFRRVAHARDHHFYTSACSKTV